MKTNFNVLALLGLCFLLVNCTFNTTQANQLSDVNDAEKMADNLIGTLRDNNYAEADKLFHKQFFDITSKDSLHSIFRKTRENLGTFKANKLLECNTKETSGSVDRTDYRVVYEVEYDKDKAVETIIMMKEGDEGEIKIVGYHVSSDAFLK